MVAAAERRELEPAVIAAGPLEARVAERHRRDIGWFADGRPPIPSPRRYSPAERGQDLPGDSRIVENRGVRIEGDGQHAAADVAPDSLRIDQADVPTTTPMQTSAARCTSGMTATC